VWCVCVCVQRHCNELNRTPEIDFHESVHRDVIMLSNQQDATI